MFPLLCAAFVQAVKPALPGDASHVVHSCSSKLSLFEQSTWWQHSARVLLQLPGLTTTTGFEYIWILMNLD